MTIEVPQGKGAAESKALATPPRASSRRLIRLDNLEQLKLEKAPVPSNLDPRLQRLIERSKRGFQPRPTTSTQAGQVAVIACVKDYEAWVALGEVKPGALVGSTPEGTIVTARVPIKRLEYLRNLENVVSLKAAQRVGTTLREVLRDIKAARALLPQGIKGRQGHGAIIGVVDFGCDFTHEDLRDAKGNTRLVGIWDQAGPSSPNSPFGYGRFYSRVEINKALKAPNPFKALGYRPDLRDPDWKSGTHGTHVLGIAGGNGRGSGQPGVAPEADLLFVDLASSDIPWEGEEVTKSSFGDSVQLLEAVQFIFDTAGGQPCVVNLSLGTNGGPHDGSTLVEKGLDVLATRAPNRAIVIAASNSYSDGIHREGTVPAGGHVDVLWDIQNGDWTDNEFELWYSGQDAFAVELLSPGGKSLGLVELDSNSRLLDQNGSLAVFVSHRMKDPGNGDNAVGILLAAGIPSGAWGVRLHGKSVQDGRFHAWIERDDEAQSSFSQPDNAYTLGSISCGKKSIVVGSYDATKKNVPLSPFSSAGPTRDKRQKPELSAPGHNVWAAKSGSKKGLVQMSGTSMAAPAVSGAVALLLAEATVRKLSLPIDELRELLRATARPMEQGWHSRYGFGRIDVSASVSALLAMPSTRPLAVVANEPSSEGPKAKNPRRSGVKRSGGRKST